MRQHRLGAGALLLLWSFAVAADSTLQIDITTHLGDGQEFQHGDRVHFLLSLNRDAYVLLIYQDAAGALTQLVPNAIERTGYYKVARYLSIPDSRVPFEFIVGPPYGTETVWAYASNAPFPELKGTTLSNGLKRLDQTVPGISAQLNEAVKRGNSNFVIHHVTLITRAALSH